MQVHACHLQLQVFLAVRSTPLKAAHVCKQKLLVLPAKRFRHVLFQETPVPFNASHVDQNWLSMLSNMLLLAEHASLMITIAMQQAVLLAEGAINLSQRSRPAPGAAMLPSTLAPLPAELALFMAVSIYGGPFCGCLFNKSPIIWDLYWGPDF